MLEIVMLLAALYVSVGVALLCAGWRDAEVRYLCSSPWEYLAATWYYALLWLPMVLRNWRRVGSGYRVAWRRKTRGD